MKRVLLPLLAALGLGARVAGACSVCLAGDPNFSTHGSASQEVGSVALYFELREWQKTSGVGGVDLDPNPTSQAASSVQRLPALRRMAHAGHEHEEPTVPIPGSTGAATAAASAEPSGEDISTRERNRSRRLDLYVAWTPLDRLTVTLDLPWAMNGVDELAPEGDTHLSLSGLGDASIGVSGVVWRNRPALPSTWLEARGWLKAPTGRDAKRVDGILDPHVQTGTGSWDFGLGTAVVHRFEWGSLYASAFYRFNGEGGLDYEYGDVALATVALDAPLGHALGIRAFDRLTPGVALDFRWADRDRQAGHDVDDTGGAIPYLTPSLRLALPSFSERHRAWLRTGVQVPLSDAGLYGEQDEGPVWSIGIGYGF